MVKWTIAILTVEQRKPLFQRLLDVLKPQVGDRDIEILIADQEDWSVSDKRQWCLDEARGDYLCFCDDDDLVASDYVERIYPLLDGVDYVGFRLQLYIDGMPQKPTFHSLRYPEWSDDAAGYYRNVSHLNPVRTEIARQGRFDGGYGEDKRWADQVHPVTEHYVDDVMYKYYFSPTSSLTYGR